MKYLLLQTVLYSLIIAQILSVQISCPEFFNGETSEPEIMSMLSKAIQEKSTSVHINCSDILIKRGFYQAANLLLNNFYNSRKLDIRPSIVSQVNHINKELDKTQAILQNASKYKKLIPVFKWGQSADYIMLYVKFSVSWNLAPCSDIYEREVGPGMGESYDFEFRATGIQNLITVGFE